MRSGTIAAEGCEGNHTQSLQSSHTAFLLAQPHLLFSTPLNTSSSQEKENILFSQMKLFEPLSLEGRTVQGLMRVGLTTLKPTNNPSEPRIVAIFQKKKKSFHCNKMSVLK